MMGGLLHHPMSHVVSVPNVPAHSSTAVVNVLTSHGIVIATLLKRVKLMNPVSLALET